MSLRSTPTPPQPGAPRSPLASSRDPSSEDEKCGECGSSQKKFEDDKMREPGQHPHTKKEEALDALDKEISKKSTIQQSQARLPDDISIVEENTNDEESDEDTVPTPRDDKRAFKVGATSRVQKGSQKTREKKRELYTMSLQFTEEELGKAISTTPLWKKLNEDLRTKTSEIQRLKKLVTSQRQMIGSLRTRLSSYKPTPNDIRDPMLIKVARNSSANRQRSPISKSPPASRITSNLDMIRRNPTISILKRGRRTPRSKPRLQSVSKRPKTTRKPKKRPSNSPRTRAQSVRASRRKSHDIPGRTEKTPYRSRAGRKKMEQTAAAAKNASPVQEKVEDIMILDDDFYQSSSPDYKAIREQTRRSKSAPKKRHHGHRSKHVRTRTPHPRTKSKSKTVHYNSSHTIKKNKASSKSRSSSKYSSHHSIPIRIDERKLPVSGEPVIVRIDLMRGHDSE